MTKYYISNNGNDKSNGDAPEKAWQSFNPIKDLTLYPGDEICLKCGDFFEGTMLLKSSGTQKSPIVLTSFGEGDKPVLKGSTLFKTEASRGNSFVCTTDKPVKGVFVDDHWLQLARYPSKGFFTIDDGDKSKLVDRELLIDNIDCTGADVRIRAVNWQYEIAKVKKHEKDTLHFVDNMIYQCNKDYGYFLDNKLDFLTEPGEWYYDKVHETLHFIDIDKKPVDKKRLEMMVFDWGIKLDGAAHIKISGIQFEKFHQGGIIALNGSNHCEIEDCSFRFIHRDGIYLDSGCYHMSLVNNTFTDIKGRGVATLDAENTSIINNFFNRIGMYPGYGFDGVNNGTGIAVLKTEVIYLISDTILRKLSIGLPVAVIEKLYSLLNLPFADQKFLISALEEKLTKEEHTFIPTIISLVKEELKAFDFDSANNHIAHNLIQNTGLHSIRLDGKNCICEYNVVKNALLYMNDGAAIYSWAQDYNYSVNSIIRKNIVINVIGNVIATPDFHRFAHGIYLDNKCVGFAIEDNVVTGSTWGILVNDESREHTITGNVVFDNEVGLAFSEYFMPGTLYGCKAFDNVLFAKKRHQRALFIESRISPEFTPAETDKNFYGSSYYTFPIVRMTFQHGHRNWEEHTLESWKKATGKDEASNYFAPADPEDRPRMSDIIVNETKDIKEFRIDNTIRDHYSIYGEKLIDKVVLDPFTAMIILED
ncbi:MAG TPA: right-handed parallel beta-helix repeat-containing protein [Bacteroidales bacterium]|nr:right-handed parallel beta-helix repeat-containing protein [Bacteroidales bacterium]